MKSISTNPFLITGYQGPDYFCDREKETASLMSALKNGRNITYFWKNQSKTNK